MTDDVTHPDDGNAEIGDGQPVVSDLPPVAPEPVPDAVDLPDDVHDGAIDDGADPVD